MQITQISVREVDGASSEWHHTNGIVRMWRETSNCARYLVRRWLGDLLVAFQVAALTSQWWYWIDRVEVPNRFV
jgi:hypothetical protein